MHFKEFSAWIAIEGKNVPEYAVEVSEDDKTVTCWIPSELGKKFSVNWKNTSYKHDTKGMVKTDGNAEGVSDGVFVKPFIFSSLELTDDDAFLGDPSYQQLGLIELEIYPIIVTGKTVRIPALQSLPHVKLHERSKKAVTQQISLGAPEPLKKRKPHTTKSQTSGPRLVKFCFRYRPADVLRANGIMPPLPPQKRKAPVQLQRAQTPDDAEEEKKLRERLRVIEAKRVKKETKPGVKTEMPDVLDLTQKENRKNKKVKIEGFIQGEIIDLT